MAVINGEAHGFGNLTEAEKRAETILISCIFRSFTAKELFPCIVGGGMCLLASLFLTALILNCVHVGP